jgi:hypothetical protein
MRRQNVVRVTIHFKGQPEDKVHERFFKSNELLLLQELVGVEPPGINLEVLTRRVRSKDRKDLDRDKLYPYIKGLVEQEVVQSRGLSAPNPGLSTPVLVASKQRLHYSTRVDTITELAIDAMST